MAEEKEDVELKRDQDEVLKDNRLDFYDDDLFTEDDRRLLTYVMAPRTVAEIAVKLGIGYSTVTQRLAILLVKKYVVRIESKKRVLYKTNVNLIRL